MVGFLSTFIVLIIIIYLNPLRLSEIEGFTYANSDSLDINESYLKNDINTETYNDNFEGTPDIFDEFR